MRGSELWSFLCPRSSTAPNTQGTRNGPTSVNRPVWAQFSAKVGFSLGFRTSELNLEFQFFTCSVFREMCHLRQHAGVHRGSRKLAGLVTPGTCRLAESFWGLALPKASDHHA